VTYACRTAIARSRRGSLNQLQTSFPRSPGIIPAALSAVFSCPRHCDCSIKEQRQRVAASLHCHEFVLHKLLTNGAVKGSGSVCEDGTVTVGRGFLSAIVPRLRDEGGIPDRGTSMVSVSGLKPNYINCTTTNRRAPAVNGMSD